MKKKIRLSEEIMAESAKFCPKVKPIVCGVCEQPALSKTSFWKNGVTGTKWGHGNRVFHKIVDK